MTKIASRGGGSSPETSVVLQHHVQGMHQEVVTGAFTMALIDNINGAAPGQPEDYSTQSSRKI